MPANVVELRGNPSKLSRDELDRRRDHARPVAGEPPEGLTRLELVVWRAHAGELARLGLLTVLDEVSFRLTVVAPGAMALQALEDLRPSKADGSPDRRRQVLELVVPDTKYGGTKRNPALSAYMQAMKEYRAGAAAFGLTPTSRVGLPTAPPDQEDDRDLFGD